MISLEYIMEEVSSLGPSWGFRLHYHPNGQRFTFNIFNTAGDFFFPVLADDVEVAFREAIRRARAFLSEGVR